MVFILSKWPVLVAIFIENGDLYLSLLEDAEDLMVDTRKRIISCNDVYTSFEIVKEDLTLFMKNLNEFRKIYQNHYRMTNSMQTEN